MLLAYTIGKYRASTIHGIASNIQRAKDLAAHLWQAKIATICPHMNSAMMDGLVDDKVFLDGTLEMLSRCDMAVTVDGWENSEGSKAEVALCKELDIPVFHSVHEAALSALLGRVKSRRECEVLS